MLSGLAWADWVDLIPPWALALWADEQTRLALPLLGAAGLLFVLLPTGNKRDRQVSQQRASDEENIKRPTNTAWLRRLWWRLRPPIDLMHVDGLVIDRTRKPHCAWLGPTGGGKSASVATVRCDGKRVYLAATPDLSDPLIDATARCNGFRWTAGVSKVPINFFPATDTPNDVAEFLTEVFRSGGVGAWKRRAYVAIVEVVRTLDAARVPRTFLTIGRGLEQTIKADRELRLVCDGWVARFLSVAEKLGESAGPNGVDLAELLGRGVSVLIDNDAFLHPGLCEDVVALALGLGMRCADRVPGGFRLIFEEAGQLGDRIDLAAPFFRAGRRRRIMVDVLTQAESDLVFHGNDGITANLATRVYFAQELKSLQKVAADRLGLDYRELDPAKMHDFTAWIAHGKIRRLVHFPKPPKSPVYRGEIIRGEEGRDSGERWRAPVPIGLSRPVLPMLPPPGAVWQKYVGGTYREGGCLRWHGKHDKAGYGYIWLEDEEKSVLIHRWRAEQAYGPIGRDPVTGKKLTVDHRRTCFKDCSDLTHLEVGVTRGENSSRRWRVRGVGTAAD